MPKKLLFQLDTDALPSSFDTVVAYDGGSDHVIPLAGISPETVGSVVEGAIYTRPPKQKQFTALFIGGSDLAAGEAVLEAIIAKFFSRFRVSVMLDSSGSNTTAAAAVALINAAVPVDGRRVVVLAGTGPIGQRAAALLASEGADVILTSRRMDRAQAATDAIAARFGATITPVAVADATATDTVLADADLVLSTGKAGVQLLSEEQWQSHARLRLLADANTEPPLGLGGLKMNDKATERHGKLTFGGLGIGALKLNLHRACIARLFESNDQVLNAAEIYALAKTMVAEQ